MKKKFKLIDLDCANCAAKMEEAIKNIDGVTDASVSFMTQNMMIEADDAEFDRVLDEAVKGRPCLVITKRQARDVNQYG